jgi:spoIIIJ-associated protein
MSKEVSITQTIETILNKMSIDFDKIDVSNNGVNTTYQIHTNDAGILIGNRGETLEALSYIIRRMVNKDQPLEERQMFVVDVNNYQTKKLEEFRQGLKVSADRVRLFKEPVELSPMSSYQRMIVHSTFSNDREIKTESDGEGRFRHVVLKYATESGVSESE